MKKLFIFFLILVLISMMVTIIFKNNTTGSGYTTSAKQEFAEKDLELLSRLIYAESRGEPLKGQISVGAVVLNRVESNRYPNTIKEVIYQPNQFCPVNDGSIENPTNEISDFAAIKAMRGTDPTNGSLYFYNPEKVSDNVNWISEKTESIRIQNHIFAK